MDIVELLTTYKYAVLFFGMLFLGETFLLPAVYLSLDGKISPGMVVLISCVATVVSDVVWYYLAFIVPFHKIRHWRRVEHHQDKFEKLSQLFDKHNYRILFLSKFVYGTRILVQILCGVKRMNFWKYIAVNIFGVLSYMVFLYFIAVVVNRSIAGEVMGGFKIAIAVFIVIVIVINLCIRYLAEKNWFQ